MNDKIIMWILVIIVLLYYFTLSNIINEKEEKEEIKPVIILYNFKKDEYITFLNIEDFYRNLYNRGDGGAMIEYFRRHNVEPYTPEEVELLISAYFKDYEIKKLDL